MKGLSKSASDILQSAPEKCKESVFQIQILCRNQARVGRIPGRIERTPRAPPAWRETPSASSAFAQENPVPTRSGYRAEGTFAQLARAALAART